MVCVKKNAKPYFLSNNLTLLTGTLILSDLVAIVRNTLSKYEKKKTTGNTRTDIPFAQPGTPKQIIASSSAKEPYQRGNLTIMDCILICFVIRRGEILHISLGIYTVDIYILYYQFIVRFLIGLDFPFITIPFQGC